jgi:chromosome segregation ATPase
LEPPRVPTSPAEVSGVPGGRERRTQPAEPRRVNDALARLHQMRTEALVAREYIRELERMLRETQTELGQARGVQSQLVEEAVWLRGRIADHESHERLLLERLDQLQAAIEVRDDEGHERDLELARLQEVLRLQREQTVFRVAAALNNGVKSHPLLATGLAPIARWLAARLTRHP